jgi:hypothetical protein
MKLAGGQSTRGRVNGQPRALRPLVFALPGAAKHWHSLRRSGLGLPTSGGTDEEETS